MTNIQEIPIEELGLKAGVLWSLKHNMGIETIGQLVEFSPAQIILTKNIGKVKVGEIREALLRHGLYLKGDEAFVSASSPQASIAGYGSRVDDPSRGAKYNGGKNRISLMSPFALWYEARLFTLGAEKYDPHNFRKGIPFSEILDAALRHLLLYWMGEEVDAEGVNHLDAARWNLGVLREQQYTHPEKDDRFKFPPEVLDRFWAEERKAFNSFRAIIENLHAIKEKENGKEKL